MEAPKRKRKGAPGYMIGVHGQVEASAFDDSSFDFWLQPLG